MTEIPQPPSIVNATEKREHEIQQRASWIGGFFEIGGLINIYTETKHDKGGIRRYAVPMMMVTDNNPTKLSKLKELLGGSIRAKSGRDQSWNWILRYNNVLPVAQVIKPFTPSTVEIITAMELCENASIDERVAIATELKGSDRFGSVSNENYKDLVENPQFIAGVIDNRGYLRYSNVSSELLRQVHIYSRNGVLLKAIQEKFGGVVRTDSKGNQELIRGKEHTLKRDSFDFYINGQNARNLLDFASPFLLMSSSTK